VSHSIPTLAVDRTSFYTASGCRLQPILLTVLAVYGKQYSIPTLAVDRKLFYTVSGGWETMLGESLELENCYDTFYLQVGWSDKLLNSFISSMIVL